MIDFTLPVPLAYAGTMVLPTGEILVFAGRNEREISEAGYILNI